MHHHIAITVNHETHHLLEEESKTGIYENSYETRPRTRSVAEPKN